ncbi:MAG: type III PLP-dependent enzyme, partial [Pseudomonadota bacterium]
MYPGRPYPKTLGELVRISAGEAPILACAPQVLRATARGFLDGFPGLVTYAVKANPDPTILENLSAAGVAAFDVASVPEIELLCAAAPQATLHYNNPVRASAEIRRAVALGVESFSLDSAGELARLRACVAPSAELSVRFKLDMPGAAYDFGAKFGAHPDAAVDLLRAVRAAGFAPSLTFHPGTQCAPIEVWQAYVAAAARIAGEARVEIKRLNVGG